MLVTCDIGQPLPLWEAHKENMSEDFLLSVQRQNPAVKVTFSEAIFNQALLDLESRISHLGSTIANCGMPQPNRSSTNDLAPELLQETSYDVEALTEYIEES